MKCPTYKSDSFKPLIAATLRDQFAMFALQGILACPHRIALNNDECSSEISISNLAYVFADAMLEARQK